MPMLLVPPRVTKDSQALTRAALAEGWQVERLANWRPPSWLRDEQLVLYGEPLFADIVAGPLGLALFECPPDWLTGLPSHYLRRKVRYSTLAEARRCARVPGTTALGSVISWKLTSVVPCWLPISALTVPVTRSELTQPPAQMPPVTSSSTSLHASPSGTSRA